MQETTYKVEYDSNNSGGYWWLSDEQWQALEKDGWTVEWGGLSFCHSEFPSFQSRAKAPDTCPKPKDARSSSCPGHRSFESYEEAQAAGKDGRWLGALATGAYIEVKAYSTALAEGVAEEWWRNTVGMDPHDSGCDCCGPPHSFWAREPKDD